jgi:chromosome segregation ATPase
MIGIPSLRTLVKLKQRRVAALGEEVKRCQQQLRDRVHELDQALAQEAACRADEQAQRDKLFNTSSSTQGFRGSDIVTLQYLLVDAEKRTVEAGKPVRAAEQKVEAARQQVRAAQLAVQRGEQQLEQRKQLLQQAIAAAERAQEDQQDEESEEAAVARILAGARAQAAEAQALAVDC